MISASDSSRAAPANSDRISTPSPASRAATYSLATRFMPSCSALTIHTFDVRMKAFTVAASWWATRKCSGFHESVRSRQLISSAIASSSAINSR